jgi:hypothetical protein
MTWWDLDCGSGVLELDAPALELFVHWVDGVTVAWWTNDLGAFLWQAQVGVA